MPVFDWTRTELAREREEGSTVLAYTRWGTKWSGAVEGLKHILRNEWDNNGLNITDNVLTAYVNPADGMFGITTTCDSMMAFMPIGVLEAYENDAYMLTMMKEVCHHNLYALANSIAMNGVGPDTTIKAVTPSLIKTVGMVRNVTYVLAVVFGALWFVGKKKFVKTEEYKNYKAFKASLKK
jgi:beta-glucosidase